MRGLSQIGMFLSALFLLSNAVYSQEFTKILDVAELLP